ncbi:MAG: cupin domain-containing protein [Zymomonas mobilis subsp. pomaceae]|uniref:Cupin 2 conserved barrel domain protein n=1 Tax=Zymomonas mobilis subsp. pomaceae (strain ATCC 29192 / DSM 22645 / JCM 10191 / CCUG 17912 / NBRC 13757 / NCIMB 11200 / NRRL B-4491 / Barker I) TaxID=579138 RepID=F8ETT5_ZYMMT|nr:cupin domain-containing protein [Zymomonas mobilis]AEI38032.1 hypothetical protein Zymop_1137 [Zymomonas mobilis subsp. pomaceae ATCC 29192]MDX5949399.1 cupin domain-containing protein [Zymomonas mobilis subsp. pomaceae]GEB89142.1 hypothetical protein ZMO02_07790 [Zymomonas mobilis subsp. pomaceae]
MKNYTKRTYISSLLFMFGAISTVFPAYAEENTGHAGQSKTLLRADTAWDGIPYKAYPQGSPELVVMQITVPAHSELDWHRHPVPNAVYILKGNVTIEDKATGKKKLFPEGTAFPEMFNKMHRGISGDEPVTMIAFYASTKGMPVTLYTPLKP